MRKREVIAALKRARKLIAKGWTQHEMRASHSGVVCYCAVGALCEATRENTLLYYAAKDRIVPFTGRGVIQFNDAEGRTQEEVLAVFDKAIAA